MLGIGMQEILIILVVALIVIGPKRLPDLAKTLGKGFAEFRKAADDLQETVRMDLQKEKHEEFRQKYPDLVPDEDEEDPAATSPSNDLAARGDGTKEEASAAAGGAIKDEPAEKTEPVPSYNPEEIEGGDETEDDTRDV